MSVAFGIGFALFVGGPQSFMFMALGPIMLLVPLIDRIVERRQQVKGSLNELARELRKFPSPQTLIASGKKTLTWWQAGVEPPTERKTRLGQRSVLVSDFVGGRSKRTVSSLVAIDARGGIEIQGPQWICEAVRIALRFNLAHAYSPFDEVPKVNAGGRWLLRVDASGNARLADRVNPHEAAVEFEVDVLDPENASIVDALERPSTVRGIRDFELRDSSPHMLVSGMTGSGKTEFIVSWLACLAENYEPASLAVAVIDFKGGGSFARIAHLSHVRHIVSDLDPAGLRAAFDGLRAQIQLRERVLLTSGVAHIEDVPSVSRPLRLVPVSYTHLTLPTICSV